MDALSFQQRQRQGDTAAFPFTPDTAHGTQEDIARLVREAVLDPLGSGTSQRPTGNDSSSSSKNSRSIKKGNCRSDGGGSNDNNATATTTVTHVQPSSSVSMQPLAVRIADRYGMPAELPPGSPQTFADLLALCPSSGGDSALREQLQQWMGRHRITDLTDVQKSSIPFALEYRDLLCIAPTATGKTFSYVFPAMLRLALDDASHSGDGGGSSRNASGPVTTSDDSNDDASPPAFSRRDVEALLKSQIEKGEVCRYCELNVTQTPVCPMTGVPHPPPPSGVELALNARTRRAMRLEELASNIAEPRVLILVPTSQLAFQVHGVCRALNAGYKIRFMVRASSADEQRKFIHSLEDGCDVLVSTPETILPALYKHKLSLKQVKTLIIDEVDDLVSTNHYEKLKIILGALPRQGGPAARPQRLLFGASLPPIAYAMIRERMLQPSHRFVLADIATDHLGHPITTTTSNATTAATAAGRNNAKNSSNKASLTTTTNAPLLTTNSRITHLVFMLGRVEKAQKLAWLYHTGKLTMDQRTIIFCNSRHNVAFVHDRLATLVPGLKVTTLTSRASATAREGVLKMFSTGISTCLVCTDLLSRGIDFYGVVYVVHYDMPAEMETWVHRTGRCGRSGSLPGYAYTFFQPENVKIAKPLVAYLRQNRQLVPPKLAEYAKQPFVDVFRRSLLLHPTRPYRRDDPQNSTPVLGRVTARFPDYRQEGIQKHLRPL